MPHCIASGAGGQSSTTASSTGSSRRSKMPVNFDPTCNAHSFPETEDAILLRLTALRAQECGPYKRSDYLRRPLPSQAISNATRDADELKRLQKTASLDSLDTASISSSLSCSSSSGYDSTGSRSSASSNSSSPSSSPASSTLSEGSLPIDAECRSVMIAWYHQVLDHCSFARENGGIAAYLLDMYLCQQEDGGAGEAQAAAIKARVDRREFQLVSMTALFLAIKMNECETITPGMVAKLSRGSFGALDVAHMETVMLRNLNWYVNPPTPLTFVNHYLELLRGPNPTKPFEPNSTLRSVLKYSKIQIELSSTDYFFVTLDPSLVAYAAILNAATCLGRRRVSPSTMIAFYQKLVDHELLYIKSANQLSQIRDRLLQCVEGPVPQSVGEGGAYSSEEEHAASSGDEESEYDHSEYAPGSPAGRKASNRSPGRKSPRSVTADAASRAACQQ